MYVVSEDTVQQRSVMEVLIGHIYIYLRLKYCSDILAKSCGIQGLRIKKRVHPSVT